MVFDAEDPSQFRLRPKLSDFGPSKPKLSKYHNHSFFCSCMCRKAFTYVFGLCLGVTDRCPSLVQLVPFVNTRPANSCGLTSLYLNAGDCLMLHQPATRSMPASNITPSKTEKATATCNVTRQLYRTSGRAKNIFVFSDLTILKTKTATL